MPATRKPIPRKIAKRWPTMQVAEKRYNKFVLPFLPKIRAIAKAYSWGNRHLADDMIAQAVIKIVAAAKKYDLKRPLQPFVLRIATNAILDVARHEAKQRQHFLLLPTEQLSLIMDARAKTPLEQLSAPKRADILKKANNLLQLINASPKQKEVFRFYAGLKDGRIKMYKETARDLKIPIGTVKSSIAAVRNEFRRLADKK